jgi:hypothetical protein
VGKPLNLTLVGDPGDTYLVTQYSNSAHCGTLKGLKYRGTVAAPLAVRTSDQLFAIIARGYDGTSIDYAASPATINIIAAQEFTSTAHGAHITFGTSAIGTVLRYERMRITSEGRIGVNTSTPEKCLEINENTGACMRLSYFKAFSPVNYVDFDVSATGDLTITPSGGDVVLAGGVQMNTQAYFDAEVANTVTAGAVTIDFKTGNKQKLAVSGAVNITLVEPTGPSSVQLSLDYAGNFTPTFTTTVNWPASTEPTWTKVNAKSDMVWLVWTGTKWRGGASLNHTT